MWDYSDKVKEYFLNPKNVGEIDGPDGVGEVGSMACGDALKFTIRVDKDTRKIVDAKFKTFGCGSAIASASALTEMVVGKTIEDARQISNKDIADFLGGLPEQKMHCSVMGREALEAAVENFETGGRIKHTKEGKIICKCFEVTEKEIEKAIVENSLTTVEQVTHYTKAGGGCGGCIPDIEEILERLGSKHPVEKKLTNLEKIEKIREVIAKEIRPALQNDGGDIELVDVEGDTVFVSLKNACANCPASGLTLRDFIQKTLQDKVLPYLVVEERKA